jgi:hypothetical protein
MSTDPGYGTYTPEQLKAKRQQRGGPGGNSGSAPLFNPWAEHIVPGFPLDVLPPIARDYVSEQSELLGCDTSAMAMAVLAAFSGALHHGFSLKMLRNGQWREHPRLWLLLAGSASVKKTHVINEVVRPLQEHEEGVRKHYECEQRTYEEIKAKNEDTAVQPPPPPPRFVVYDTTVEKLAEILSRSDRGLLVKRDEFSGWLGSMERYGGHSRGAGADRGFWLQAFDGGHYTVDRVNRGERHVENLSVSLIGGIQPEKLIELRGLTADGLLQRFLPVMMSRSRLPLDRPGNTTKYDQLVRDLLLAESARLIMDDDGVDMMYALLTYLHEVAEVSGGLAKGFQSFIGKLDGYAGRLALILHMAADPRGGAAERVNQATVHNVYRLIAEFIIPHALEFYRTAERIGGSDTLRKIASWILTSGKERIVASDLTANIADLRGINLWELNRKVDPLVAVDWLARGETGPTNRVWKVNPRVAVQFAEQARIEQERKATLAHLMGSTRKETPS